MLLLAAAAPESVTVPVTLPGARTRVGFRIRPVSVGADTVRGALAVDWPTAAPIVTVTSGTTGWVVTTNVAVVLPAGTVTVSGKVAVAVSLLDRPTVSP